jgi:uncharacterized membrane protein YbhN (UPF0104 family)
MIELTSSSVEKRGYGFWIASFLGWMFMLIVCMLIIGFPVLILAVAITTLGSIALHPLLSTSSALVLGGGMVSAYLLGAMAIAILLTSRGIHPGDVSWLSGWNRSPNPSQAIYGVCPLTCEVEY